MKFLRFLYQPVHSNSLLLCLCLGSFLAYCTDNWAIKIPIIMVWLCALIVGCVYYEKHK